MGHVYVSKGGIEYVLCSLCFARSCDHYFKRSTVTLGCGVGGRKKKKKQTPLNVISLPAGGYNFIHICEVSVKFLYRLFI